ncbi:pyruvate carboxylase, partial [Pavlovales sp. CCMP2436]
FGTILVANRGEIAIRICRAIHELGGKAVAIYSQEDAYAKHRRMGDAAFLLNPEGSGVSPVGAYLDIPRIIQAAKEMGAQAIHPGYGFLSENAKFAQACEDNGIVFIGPTPKTISEFGSKTDARKMAIQAGLPVIPGSSALANLDEAIAFAEKVGFPLMVKATMGGGGKGMRIVRDMPGLLTGVPSAVSEALASF